MAGLVQVTDPLTSLADAVKGLKLDSSATSSGALFKKKSADLRRTIITIYKNQYAGRSEPWYNHLYSHLACYIRDRYPGQYKYYAPVLDTYPMTSVNMILQPNLIKNLEYVFGDDFLYDWAASRYWCDPSEHTLRSGVHFVMTGGGSHEEYMKQYGGGQSGGSRDLIARALEESALRAGFPSYANFQKKQSVADELGVFPAPKTYLEQVLGVPRNGYIVDRADVYDNGGRNVIYDYVRQSPSPVKHVFSENPHLDIVDNAKVALRRRFSSGDMIGSDVSESVEQLYELVRSTRQGGGIHKHIYRSIGKDSHLLDLYKDVAIWLEEERLQKHIGLDQYDIWSNSLLSGYRDILIAAKASLTAEKFNELITYLTSPGVGKIKMHDALKAAYSDVVSGHGDLDSSLERVAQIARESIDKLNQGQALGGARKPKKPSSKPKKPSAKPKKSSAKPKKSSVKPKKSSGLKKSPAKKAIKSPAAKLRCMA